MRCAHIFVNGVCRDCGYECVHNYVWNGLTVEPTCTESGLADTICFNCNSVGTKYIEPLGHNCEHVVVQSTCTENGYDGWQCSRCDYLAIDSTLALAGHNYADGVCNSCGISCSHNWSNGVCKDCGHECSHNSWRESCTPVNSTYHTLILVCSTCNYRAEEPNEEHYYKDGSGVCWDCDYECSHDFSILCEQLNSTYHTFTWVCEICDHRVEEPNEEHYYEDGSKVCADCGYERS